MYREHKPTVDEVRPLVAALYESHLAGCCLHIVLDDGNVEGHSVDFCLADAVERGHESCAVLARALRSMTRRQRRKLYVTA